jgi:hypothetical protein
MRGLDTPVSSDPQIALRHIRATNCTAVVTLRLPLKLARLLNARQPFPLARERKAPTRGQKEY